MKPPKAKRQRSTLRQDGREPAVAKHHGEEQPLQDEEPVSEEVSSRAVIMNDLALRGPRKQEKRGDHADGTITLVRRVYF